MNRCFPRTSSSSRHGRTCRAVCLYECDDGGQDWRTVQISAMILPSTTYPYIREPLPATDVCTLMWLLPGMGANVNSQGTPLNEAFPTPWSHTRVRSLVRMDSIVSLKIRLSVKTLQCTVSWPIYESRILPFVIPCCMFANHTGKVVHWARFPLTP